MLFFTIAVMALGLFAISGSAASETAYSKDIRAESESTEAETENDAGWRSGSFYNTETLEVWLEYGPFSYIMHFDGEVPPEEAEEFDVSEGIADMKVLDAAFEGLGDASYIE